MKILDTKSGKFGRFMKKNGGLLMLVLVAASISVAAILGIKSGKKPPTQNSSQINLSGDEESWNINSQMGDTTQTDAQVSSTLQPSSSQEQLSSSKPSGSQNASSGLNESQNSQKLLFILPVNSQVLNKYSGNKPVKSKTMGDWRLHTGIDLSAEKGTSVKASAEGKVSKIYNDAMWGTTVEIEHSNGMTSIYSSLSDKVYVEKGQAVESGQSIGTVSDTAKIEGAEASHLHFAIKQGGKYIDPESVITKPIGSK